MKKPEFWSVRNLPKESSEKDIKKLEKKKHAANVPEWERNLPMLGRESAAQKEKLVTFNPEPKKKTNRKRLVEIRPNCKEQQYEEPGTKKMQINKRSNPWKVKKKEKNKGETIRHHFKKRKKKPQGNDAYQWEMNGKGYRYDAWTSCRKVEPSRKGKIERNRKDFFINSKQRKRGLGVYEKREP